MLFNLALDPCRYTYDAKNKELKKRQDRDHMGAILDAFCPLGYAALVCQVPLAWLVLSAVLVFVTATPCARQCQFATASS